MKYQQLTLVLVEKLEKDIFLNNNTIKEFKDKINDLKTSQKNNYSKEGNSQYISKANLIKDDVLLHITKQIEIINLYLQLSSLLTSKEIKAEVTNSYKLKYYRYMENALTYFTNKEAYEVCQIIKESIDSLVTEVY